MQKHDGSLGVLLVKYVVHLVGQIRGTFDEFRKCLVGVHELTILDPFREGSAFQDVTGLKQLFNSHMRDNLGWFPCESLQ